MVCTYRLGIRTLPVGVGSDPGNCLRSPVSAPESEHSMGCAWGVRGRHSSRRSMPFQGEDLTLAIQKYSRRKVQRKLGDTKIKRGSMKM